VSPPSLEEVLAAPAPRRIPDVLARMRAVEAALPTTDGLACFLRLYVRVTEAVNERVQQRALGDPRFVPRLDVVFANLFFRALRAAVGGRGTVPKAWAPLVEARSRSGVAPIQFALAGMNAHINRDLPVALVQTWRVLQLEPRRRSPQYADFTALNALLEETEETVKEWFATGLVGELDVALGRIDDVIAMWNVARAREAAWVNGETLWALREAPKLHGQFLLTLDRMVGFAGRGLLRPFLPPA
jgi:Family of unknown function (DUF5995)